MSNFSSTSISCCNWSPKYKAFSPNKILCHSSLNPQWFRGNDYDCSQELKEMAKSITREATTGQISMSDLFRKHEHRKPLLIVLGLVFFLGFDGPTFLIYYSQTIFIEAGSNIDSGLSGFLLSIALIMGSAVTIFGMDACGRKIPLILARKLYSANCYMKKCHLPSTICHYIYINNTVNVHIR
jgi:hypothetical protein